MKERILIAGAGGQGILLLGKIVATLYMQERYNVTYLPSYGAEVRGGTANCHVVISEEEIASPVVGEADVLIIMNKPSLIRFKNRLAKGGVLFLNTSLIDNQELTSFSKGVIIEIPATQIANQLGNWKVSNMVMLGAYVGIKQPLDEEKVMNYVEDLFGGKPELKELNKKAILQGIELGTSYSSQ